MTYTLTAQPNTIVRDADGAFIPLTPTTSTIKRTSQWLNEGNEPNPVPGDPMPPIEDAPRPDIVEVNAQVQDIDARLTALETEVVQLRRRQALADTITVNYAWVKPQIAGSPTTWGNKLNSDLDLIDAQVYANEQSGVQIGFINMYGGATPPTNWLMCDGSSLATTGTYAACSRSSAMPLAVRARTSTCLIYRLLPIWRGRGRPWRDRRRGGARPDLGGERGALSQRP